MLRSTNGLDIALVILRNFIRRGISFERGKLTAEEAAFLDVAMGELG